MARVYRDRLISDLNDEAAKVKTEIELAQKQVSQLSMDLADKGLQGKAYNAVQKHFKIAHTLIGILLRTVQEERARHGGKEFL